MGASDGISRALCFIASNLSMIEDLNNTCNEL